MSQGCSTNEGRPKSVFVGSMWAYHNFGNANDRHRNFLLRARPRLAHLIDGILLYDEAIVPTQDFLSLTVLLSVLGEETVLDLLREGELRFIRMKGAFAYVGNGGGLLGFTISGDSPKNQMDPPFLDDEHSVDWALSGVSGRISDGATMKKAVLSRTMTVEGAELKECACHETYLDIMKSPYLRQFFPPGADLTRLPGIGPKDVRCCDFDSDQSKQDCIELVLRLSSANVELRLAKIAGAEDATTLNPVGVLLKGKSERSFLRNMSYESWLHLVEVDGQPDVARVVLDKPVGDRASVFREILRARRSRNGAAFRDWFHANCRINPAEVSKHYVELLKSVPVVSSLPARIVRFITTSAVGLIPGVGSILGTAVSAADSFFVDSWLRGASPKFFIDDLRQITRDGGAR